VIDEMPLIEKHPILEFKHDKKAAFTFDGRAMEGFEGEPIAAALHTNGVMIYRETPEMKRPRGFFCAIGKCSSCFMVVDGVPNVRTCVTPLRDGMSILTQHGKGTVAVPGEAGR
jgi:predicted molibdopterin-dependent oxidoreductase YjgC